MIISKTPLRISFLGGGTDYPDYYKLHGGATLATSINQFTYVTVSPLAPFFKHSIGIHYSKVEKVTTLDEIEHPAVRECLRYMGIERGIEIHIATDLPARTGLGSSSSFTVGLLNALYAFKGVNAAQSRLAEEAVYIEQEMIKERVGSQDQYACALGGLNLLSFDSKKVEASKLTLSEDRFAAFCGHISLFYTGTQRHAHCILSEQIQRTITGSNDAVLEEMKSHVGLGAEILTDVSRDILDFGHLLDDAWALKKKCSSQISNELIDECYTVAKDNGALGGKLLGAGGGGFMLFFAKPEARLQLEKSMAELNIKRVSFEFEDTGSQIIFEHKS